MSASRWGFVVAGILNDSVFNHLCFIAESLATQLPNFYFKSVCKTSADWKPWVEDVCAVRGWSHTKSPLIWKEIGITNTNVHYIGGARQFWELLHKYYNVTLYLTEEDLQCLQSDLLFLHNIKQRGISLGVQGQYRCITIIGAGRSLCPDLVPQLVMTKELWLSHGTVINLYDEPGCFFKLKKIMRDIEGVGGGLNRVRVMQNIQDGLDNCDILIYLDDLLREENERTGSWLRANYESMKQLSQEINKHAPSHMKVIVCSTGPTCFCVNVMHTLVTKLSKANVVAVSSHYGLEIMYNFVRRDLNLQEFGCPPVWGYLGVSQFVDICHVVQKCDVFRPNKRALILNKNLTLPIGTKHSELRWLFYMAHNKNPYENHFQRKALIQYQVGRTDDFQKCRAICDLLKLWYSNNDDVSDVIISLGISSDGTFGIPKALVFSQPVCLKILEDNSRVWVPFADFPMPNMPLSIFRNLIHTAVIYTNKILGTKISFSEDVVT